MPDGEKLSRELRERREEIEERLGRIRGRQAQLRASGTGAVTQETAADAAEAADAGAAHAGRALERSEERHEEAVALHERLAGSSEERGRDPAEQHAAADEHREALRAGEDAAPPDAGRTRRE